MLRRIMKKLYNSNYLYTAAQTPSYDLWPMSCLCWGFIRQVFIITVYQVIYRRKKYKKTFVGVCVCVLITIFVYQHTRTYFFLLYITWYTVYYNTYYNLSDMFIFRLYVKLHVHALQICSQVGRRKFINCRLSMTFGPCPVYVEVLSDK
jgi:hypothetical protein